MTWCTSILLMENLEAFIVANVDRVDRYGMGRLGRGEVRPISSERLCDCLFIAAVRVLPCLIVTDTSSKFLRTQIANTCAHPYSIIDSQHGACASLRIEQERGIGGLDGRRSDGNDAAAHWNLTRQ